MQGVGELTEETWMIRDLRPLLQLYDCRSLQRPLSIMCWLSRHGFVIAGL